MTHSLLVVFLLSSGVLWAGEKYQYVIDATNEIMRLNSKAADPGSADLAKAAAQACAALKQLLEDREFRSDLEKWKGAAARTREERTKLKRDLRLFANGFMRPEIDALRKAGLSPYAVNRLASAANLFNQSLDAEYDPNRIVFAITAFRNEVCQSGQAFQAAADAEARQLQLQRWAFRLGGITLVVVDLTAAPASAAVTAGSIAIGGAIAGWQ